MIRRIAIVLLALIPGVAIAAGPDPSIPPGQILRGLFVQERHLKGFKASFRSEGHFVLAPEKGLIWDADKPFVVNTVITASGIVQVVGGNETMRLSAARLPFLSRLYDMMGGALAGNWQALEKDFSVERSGDAKVWTVVLTPRVANAQMPFRGLTAKGSRFVESVEITEASDDTDDLTFVDQTVSSTPLSSDEEKEFAALNK
ncbi:MAG TPA: outer membrane lipoprotein carrier protein LolA [Magnetospirillaceae bacterium]|jgi:hypothetical protein